MGQGVAKSSCYHFPLLKVNVSTPLLKLLLSVPGSNVASSISVRVLYRVFLSCCQVRQLTSQLTKARQQILTASDFAVSNDRLSHPTSSIVTSSITSSGNIHSFVSQAPSHYYDSKGYSGKLYY